MIDSIIYLASFVFVLTVVVFVHEFGHFIVARLCGVRVEQFSIGFGREIVGFTDKNQTRWKICMIPLGGYVKMFGERLGNLTQDDDEISKTDKEQSIAHKSPYQRMAIVAAGPIANFILSVILIFGMFLFHGISTVPPIIGNVIKDSPAESSGIETGDKIIEVNQKKVSEFVEVATIIRQSEGKSVAFKIIRGSKVIDLSVTPKITVDQEKSVAESYWFVGISPASVETKKVGMIDASKLAFSHTGSMIVQVFVSVKDIMVGKAKMDQLGGPIKIAEYSAKSAKSGVLALIWFIAVISINLGAINLLPIPVLDGGHLVFALIEVIRRKSVSLKIQSTSIYFGVILLFSLMVLVTINDIIQLFN